MITTDKQAKEIMISLGRAGKMPCPTYNTPAKLCNTGSRLRKVKGSTCHGCYAMKGNYLFPMVQKGLQKRFEAFLHPRFVEAMTFMIKRHSKKSGYFRWFDSGDVQSVEMALNILEVCERSPEKNHWIPTKEHKIWKNALKKKALPENVVLRFSAYMVNKAPSNNWQWSSAVTDNNTIFGVECNAPKQNGKCLDCRACWNKNVKTVTYHKH